MEHSDLRVSDEGLLVVAFEDRDPQVAADIANALQRQSVGSPIGELQGEQENVLLRFDDQRKSAEEFEDLVVISGSSGAAISLGEIATITDRFDRDEQKVIFNGQRAGQFFANQRRDFLASLVQRFCKALCKRLLVELGRGQGKAGCNFFARTRFRRVAPGKRKLAVARQHHGSRQADVGMHGCALDRCACRIRRRRVHLPQRPCRREPRLVLRTALQRTGFAGGHATAAGLAGVRVDHDGQQFGAVFLFCFRVDEERLGDRDGQGAEFADDLPDSFFDGLLAVVRQPDQEHQARRPAKHRHPAAPASGPGHHPDHWPGWLCRLERLGPRPGLRCARSAAGRLAGADRDKP